MHHLKTFLAASAACCLFLTTTPTCQAERIPEVEILTTDGQRLIAADEILSYDWATHTITLKSQVREKLLEKLRMRLVSGVGFELTIDKRAVYGGTLTTVNSSRSFDTPVIVLDWSLLDKNLAADQIRIQLGYPSPPFFKGDDPRGNRQLREALQAANKLYEGVSEHTEWIAESLTEMQTVKPGMTRGDLLKVFSEEGGLSTRTEQRYAYRDCPYIKVNVKFEAVGALDDKLGKHPEDKITKISTPFLEWSIRD